MKAHALVFAMALCLPAGISMAQVEAATGTQAPAEHLRFYRQRIAEAHQLYSAEKHAEASTLLNTLLTDPLFTSLGKAEQRVVLSEAAWSSAMSGDLPRASALYAHTNALGFHDPDDWLRTALVELDLQRSDNAALALKELVERHPTLLPNVDPEIAPRIIHATAPDSDARLALLQALFDANWRDPSDAQSSFWYLLALQRVLRGEPEQARGPLARISDPTSLVRLRSDRRFDALVNRNVWRTNVASATQRQVDALRDDVQARPANLDARIQLGYALITHNQPQALLDLMDDALDRIAAAAPDAPPFEDMHNQPWLLDHRMRRLGRHEEALAEARRGSQLREDGQPNVSQALNLGTVLCAMKRPREALDAIDTVGEMSGYGRTVQATIRHCAAVQLGDAATAQRELAYLREHQADGERNYLKALLIGGDQDTAAAFLIGMLQSEQARGEALEWMQGYTHLHPFPLDAEFLAIRDTLLARKDVRKALDAVGRVENYPIDGLVGGL